MNITGAVKIKDFPEEEALTTVTELLQSLEKYLLVQLPVEAITNVYVSADEPTVTERDIVWFKLDSSGNYAGQFIYVAGTWVQMHPPPQQIIRMYGDSNNIPTGYSLITEDTPNFTSAMASHLQADWMVDPEDSERYLIFDVVYSGV